MNMKLFQTSLVVMFLGVAQAHAQVATLPAEREEEADLIGGVCGGPLGDSFDRTLYVFDPDQAAGKPTCNGTCAEKWPPYLLSGQEVASLQPPLGVQTRDNGLPQLTYKGRPVYTFFADREAGDAKGEGLGGVWHSVQPD